MRGVPSWARDGRGSEEATVDIGKPKRIIEIEPTSVPLPETIPAPDPLPVSTPEPAEPAT